MFARDSDKGETHEAVFLSLKMQKHFFLARCKCSSEQDRSYKDEAACKVLCYKQFYNFLDR